MATAWEEVGRQKAAAGEWLEGAIGVLDAQLPSSYSPPQASEQPEEEGGERQAVPAAAPSALSAEEEEAMHWQRFALLREWVRLGIPARGNIR